MARIEGVDPDQVDRYAKDVFARTRRWARHSSTTCYMRDVRLFFVALRGMWTGIEASGLIDPRLQALLNSRVAVLMAVSLTGHNAAVGSDLGVTTQKIDALPNYASSDYYDEPERIALEYADAITLSDQDVSDELFAKLREFFNDDAIVELTVIIAWENASSKFNRALRVPSQKLWQRR